MPFSLTYLEEEFVVHLLVFIRHTLVMVSLFLGFRFKSDVGVKSILANLVFYSPKARN
jgi:hypothetical protein